MEAEILRALADSTRRAVFERLTEREMSVWEPAAGFPASQPAISQHLATLRTAGPVTERRQGRHAFCRATQDGLVPLADWLDRYGAHRPARLREPKDGPKEMDE